MQEVRECIGQCDRMQMRVWFYYMQLLLHMLVIIRPNVHNEPRLYIISSRWSMCVAMLNMTWACFVFIYSRIISRQSDGACVRCGQVCGRGNDNEFITKQHIMACSLGCWNTFRAVEVGCLCVLCHDRCLARMQSRCGRRWQAVLSDLSEQGHPHGLDGRLTSKLIFAFEPFRGMTEKDVHFMWIYCQFRLFWPS